jgi:hypothetical protein
MSNDNWDSTEKYGVQGVAALRRPKGMGYTPASADYNGEHVLLCLSWSS